MSKNVLGYKKNEKGKRVKGVATIKAGQKDCRVTFHDENVEFDNGTNIKKFSLDSLPKFPTIEQGSEDDYLVVLNADGDEVEVIAPIEGVFPAKCVDFSRPDGEDSDPAPFEKQGSKGNKEWSYLAFLAFFKITKGQFKGVKIPYFLQYKFADNGDGYAMWDGDPTNPKALWLPKLIEFCEKFDIVSTPIPWTDDGNILPTLLERILDVDKTVSIVVKDGFIDSILSGKVSGADEDDEPKKLSKNDVDEVDEEFPPVKTKKRTVEEINEEMGYKDEKPSAKPVNKVKKVEVEEDEDL